MSNIQIVLTSIIRNEENTITRLLDSIKHFVTHIVLCDTGSTDHTIDVVKQWSSKHPHLPLYIFQDEWKHFGHNRTLSIIHAKSVIPDKDHDRTFMLFLDADMIFRMDPFIEKHLCRWKEETLVKSQVWYLYQRNTNIEYHNIRFIRMDCPATCRGPTHEYYHVEPNKEYNINQTEHLSYCGNGYLEKRIWIDDIGDGGCKTDKYERDVRLLEAFLRDEKPEDDRTLFYLGNSYKNMGNFEKAIDAYTRRIFVRNGQGGWKEERYLSWIYRGECHQQLKQEHEAVNCFMNAIQVIPYRIEAWYRLIHYYRQKQWYFIAYVLLRHAQLLPQNFQNRDIPLFLETSIYDYLLDQELSIIGYYVGDKKGGKDSCEKLLSSHPTKEYRTITIPESVSSLARSNYKFYQ